jgi:hypothetical protein
MKTALFVTVDCFRSVLSTVFRSIKMEEPMKKILFVLSLSLVPASAFAEQVIQQSKLVAVGSCEKRGSENLRFIPLTYENQVVELKYEENTLKNYLAHTLEGTPLLDFSDLQKTISTSGIKVQATQDRSVDEQCTLIRNAFLKSVGM